MGIVFSTYSFLYQDFERWLWYWTGIPLQIHYFWPLSQIDHQMAARCSSEIHFHQKRLKESQLVNQRIILLQLISFSVTRINLTPLRCWSTAPLPPPPKKKGFPDGPLPLKLSLCTWLERCTVRVKCLA